MSEELREAARAVAYEAMLSFPDAALDTLGPGETQAMRNVLTEVLAPLLAAQAAVERVEALAEAWRTTAGDCDRDVEELSAKGFDEMAHSQRETANTLRAYSAVVNFALVGPNP